MSQWIEGRRVFRQKDDVLFATHSGMHYALFSSLHFHSSLRKPVARAYAFLSLRLDLLSMAQPRENDSTFFLIENLHERFFTSSFFSSSSSSSSLLPFRLTYMVTLLTIQVLSIVSTALTNLIGILAFATDYWSIIVYDLAKLHSQTKWSAVENLSTGDVQIIPHLNFSSNDGNRTDPFTFNEQDVPGMVFGINNDTILYKMHKGIFRQCNYLSINVRERLKLSQCRVLKLGNNRYDDVLHGMNNPGRELIRKYPILFAESREEAKTGGDVSLWPVRFSFKLPSACQWRILIHLALILRLEENFKSFHTPH